MSSIPLSAFQAPEIRRLVEREGPKPIPIIDKLADKLVAYGFINAPIRGKQQRQGGVSCANEQNKKAMSNDRWESNGKHQRPIVNVKFDSGPISIVSCTGADDKSA